MEDSAQQRNHFEQRRSALSTFYSILWEKMHHTMQDANYMIANENSVACLTESDLSLRLNKITI